MKKIIFGIALLSTTFLVSCKKSYTCNCNVTTVQTLVAIMSEYEPYEGTETSTNTTITESKDISKSTAQATCASGKETFSETDNDAQDIDGDGNTRENAYKRIEVVTSDCSLSKK